MNDLEGIIEDCYKSDLVSNKVIKKVIEIIGQEEWQILHDENNDVCTTMGELIITLEGIAELEKENAELKEQCSILADCNTCTSTCKTENIEMKKQLTKAKKIIKKFSEFVNNDVEYDPEHPQEYTDLWNKLCKEAEQFLNEVEK